MIIIFGILIFTFVAIAAGYKLAIIRWQPKDLIKKLEKYNNMNIELSNNMEKLNDINKQKDIWYIQQLNNLSLYIKEKYNDDYIYNKLEQQGYIKNDTKKYKIDDILDKAAKYGIKSLTKEEIEYFKNYGKIK